MSWPGVELHEREDGIDFRLTDPALTWVRIDHQTRLQFGEAELVIETPFRLGVDGDEHRLDPAERAGLGPLVNLYPSTVESLHMRPNGTLVATFEGGAVLTVEPHDKYEAWNIGGFWCPPGGLPTSV